MDTIASRLRHAMALRGMTQQQVADRAEVSQGTIGNIAAGIRGGSASLAVIADALDVRYRWLRLGELPMQAGASLWPFEAVSYDRFSALTERQRGEVEGAMAQAIERIEARVGNRLTA